MLESSGESEEQQPVHDAVYQAEREARRKRERKERKTGRLDVREGEPGWRLWLRSNLRAGILRFGKNVRPHLNALLAKYAIHGDPPIYDPAILPFAAELEANWEVIRKEAEFILTARANLPPLKAISPDHDRIAADERWKVFFLKGYGYWQLRNCDLCPETYRLVRDIPSLESAFFSILEAGRDIRRHKGPTKAIMTVHLGVMIPKDRDNCWIEVAKQRRHWDEGKLLVFDDTYKHQVRNDTDEDRVVLLLHVLRPMRFPGSLVSKLIFGAIKLSPFVQDGVRNHKRRQDRLDRAANLR